MLILRHWPTILIAAGMLQSAQAVTRIACVGTSITSGCTYPEMLQQLLGSHFEVHNSGVSGSALQKNSDSPYWQFSEFWDAFSLRPNIIIMEFGTNDSKPVNWRNGTNRFQNDYNAMIDSFAAISSHPQIFLMLSPPAFSHNWNVDGDTIEQRIIPIIQGIAAARHLPVIDCHWPLLPFPQYFSDGVHPDAGGAGVDSMAHIVCRSIAGKPYIELSDVLLTFTYDIGGARTIQSKPLSVVNQAANGLLDQVTLAKKAPWLILSLNAGRLDSQVIINQVDPTGLPETEKQYFDTVIVHSLRTITADQKYRVLLWIRPVPVFSAVCVLPETLKVTAGQSCILHAIALNQFKEPMAVQPSFSWKTSAGVIKDSLYTPPAAVGKYPVIATAGGQSDTGVVMVHRFPFLPDTGYVKQLLLLEQNNSPYLPCGANGIDYNFLGNETSVRPAAGAAATVSGNQCVWRLCQSQTGMWVDSMGADNFVAYGALYLYSPVARKVIIRCKQDDIMKIWFNATQVYNQVYGGTGEHISDALTLAPGLTRVLMKLLEGGWTNYFALRFTEPSDANVKELQYTFSPDTTIVGMKMAPRESPGMHGDAVVMRRDRNNLCISSDNPEAASLFIRTIDGKTIVHGAFGPMKRCSTGALPAGIYVIEIRNVKGIPIGRRTAAVQIP